MMDDGIVEIGWGLACLFLSMGWAWSCTQIFPTPEINYTG